MEFELNEQLKLAGELRKKAIFYGAINISIEGYIQDINTPVTPITSNINEIDDVIIQMFDSLSKSEYYNFEIAFEDFKGEEVGQLHELYVSCPGEYVYLNKNDLTYMGLDIARWDEEDLDNACSNFIKKDRRGRKEIVFDDNHEYCLKAIKDFAIKHDVEIYIKSHWESQDVYATNKEGNLIKLFYINADTFDVEKLLKDNINLEYLKGEKQNEF